MGDLTRVLHEIQRGAVAGRLLPEILQLAEREGILDCVRRLSPFSCEDLCRALQVELGYDMAQGNRPRMICLLLSHLSECGVVREQDGVWSWSGAEVSTVGSPVTSADGQFLFLRDCLECVPAYLRGGAPFLLFDEKSAAAWERFLGCEEFRTCRALLLELMRIENHSAFRLLDLCHGPGWGLEAALSRFPAIQITALDFTEAFSGEAKERAERAQARHRWLGNPATPIRWVGPEHWKGFGHPFPFPDGSFEAVFFSCGDPYIPHDLRDEVYREIARVLAPEGRLGILTRCRPEPGAQPLASSWLRISALVHDFAESVCEGWEGFSDAEENIRIFSAAGFQGGLPLLGTMSVLESSLWVLKKGHCHG